MSTTIWEDGEDLVLREPGKKEWLPQNSPNQQHPPQKKEKKRKEEKKRKTG